MAAKNVVLKKKIGNYIESLYPKTLAANVYMESGKTVEQEIADLKSTLCMDTIYMMGPNGQPLNDGSTINDGAALNLVAVY